jgi:diguanylate cyclase (GGDEF)-like protein
VTRDITERKKAEKELIFMANHDALTGLHNRKALVEFLETEIQHAHSTQNRIVLLFFDLNKFKIVNDTYGHEIGDRLLAKIAQRLKKAVRESDFVARLGGDEFTIILKNPPDHLPDKIVRRIAIDLAAPFDFGTQRIDFVSASIGMAKFPDDGTTAGELMRNADQAMYDAKKTLNGERTAIDLAAGAYRDERA